MATTATRTEQPTLPAPGVWSIDTAHSSVEFVVRHLMVAKVRGRFDEWSGDVHIGEHPEDSTVAVEISVGSISTGDAQRDGHLQSPDFFDVEHYPTISLRSNTLRLGEGGHFRLDGELTVRGVTRPVTLEAEYHGYARDPFGNEKIVFSAATEVDREEFGLTWNQSLETGGVLVGKKARIEIEVEATRQT
jgi:polyisoprenoid-binding protein YceI